MSRTKPPIWAVVTAAAVVGALIGAGAVYTLQRNELAATETRVTAIKAILTRTTAEKDALLERVAELSKPGEETTTSVEPVPTPTEPTTQPDDSPATPLPSSRFAFVKKLTTGLPGTITLDYADFLTGSKAADAAAAHGDESPPPNDYYIVNDNAKLRTFKVAANAKIRLVTNADGTSDPSGHDVTLKEWAAAFATPSDENAGIRAGGYWVVIENDTVVAVREQFIP